MNEPEGFRAPLCRPLTIRPLKGGIPHQGAYLLWGIVTLVSLPDLRLYFVPFGLVFHLIWAQLMRRDQHFVDTFFAAFRLPERLDL